MTYRHRDQPTLEQAYKYATKRGIQLREAMGILGSRYAFYWWRRTKVVWHVTDRANVDSILQHGLTRGRKRGPAAGRGIFFLSRYQHTQEPLIGIDDPVILEIDKAGILKPGTEERHDNHEDDWDLSAMYTTAERIDPQYIRLAGPPEGGD